MNTDFKGKRSRTFRQAVFFAYNGIVRAFKSERNFRFQLFAAFVVMTLAVLLSVSLLETVVLLLVIAVTLTLELINTAIEHVVDLVTTDEHPQAKAAKDIAAGAVLVFSIFAVIIGVLIFYEPVMTFFYK